MEFMFSPTWRLGKCSQKILVEYGSNLYFVHHKGRNTVSCRARGSNQRRATVCITVAADGTKLPQFYIFKGVPGAQIETMLLEDGVLGCCRINGWFDEVVGKKYISVIPIPYFAKDHKEKFIMRDHFKCHLQTSFVSELSELGCDVDYIPAGYTCVLQPCDVGVNAPLKCSIPYQHSECVLRIIVICNLGKIFRCPNVQILLNGLKMLIQRFPKIQLEKRF
jgi:DDE superfamily endonuclease